MEEKAKKAIQYFFDSIEAGQDIDNAMIILRHDLYEILDEKARKEREAIRKEKPFVNPNMAW